MRYAGPFKGYAFGVIWSLIALLALLAISEFLHVNVLAVFWISPALIAFVAIALLGVAMVHELRERKRTRYRMESGLCVYCGYDLHGTDADRCAECGRLIWRPRNPMTGAVIPLNPVRRD